MLQTNNANQVRINLTKDLDYLVVTFQTSLGPALNQSEALYTLLSGNVGSPPAMSLESRLTTLEQAGRMSANTGIFTSNRFTRGLTLETLRTGSVGPAPVPSHLEDIINIKMGALAD